MESKNILSEYEKIELQSDEIQEILDRPPSWLVRWGVTHFLILLIIIIAGSFIFRYPDVINSSAVILSENPPIPIVAFKTGKIDHLLIQNEKNVRKGDYLAIIENTANHNHIFELEKGIEEFKKYMAADSFAEFTGFSDQYILGPIQSDYSNFYKQYKEFSNYLKVDIIYKKIASSQQQIKDYQMYSKRLRLQTNNQEAIVNLSYRQYQRDSSLFGEKVIALSEFEKTEQNYLLEKINYQNLLASLSDIERQINQLKYQIIDLQSQHLNKTSSLLNSLREAFNNLEISIIEWKRDYVLSSPIDGTVTFTSVWSQNQFINTGEQIFYVVPTKHQKIIGKLRIPVNGAGKIKVGHEVLIRLDNYPHTEFGVLTGTIERMSLVPTDFQNSMFYTAEISLKNGLVTDYNKTLPFNQKMQGTAEIITDEITLIERVIAPIKSVLQSNKRA